MEDSRGIQREGTAATVLVDWLNVRVTDIPADVPDADLIAKVVGEHNIAAVIGGGELTDPGEGCLAESIVSGLVYGLCEYMTAERIMPRVVGQALNTGCIELWPEETIGQVDVSEPIYGDIEIEWSKLCKI